MQNLPWVSKIANKPVLKGIFKGLGLKKFIPNCLSGFFKWSMFCRGMLKAQKSLKMCRSRQEEMFRDVQRSYPM
ncbi:MAG: hypothetical protein CM15mP117_12910 [Alphaproteobacteria bacterium]|nr:MAG: hypothetical protein CM15mP117_12910 [Alphaproteobacteria bacterium]